MWADTCTYLHASETSGRHRRRRSLCSTHANLRRAGQNLGPTCGPVCVCECESREKNNNSFLRQRQRQQCQDYDTALMKTSEEEEDSGGRAAPRDSAIRWLGSKVTAAVR